VETLPAQATATCTQLNDPHAEAALPCVLVALVFALTRYGSILIDVTLSPACLSSTPMDDDVIPLPSPLTTPPVTATYFIWRGGGEAALLAVSRRRNERA
jgi:hypothetical protein